jgi:mycofactocin precursor
MLITLDHRRAVALYWHSVPLRRAEVLVNEENAQDEEALMGDELLVEEVSIDGMCGVY